MMLAILPTKRVREVNSTPQNSAFPAVIPLMIPPDTDIEGFHQDRQLVSFRRDAIGDGELQGYILAVSASLILFHHIRDFSLNGYLLIDRSHVSKIRFDSTNQFHHKLLVQNGLFETVDFDADFRIETWAHYLASLAPNSLVIVEQELSDPPFVHYGVFLGVDADDFVILHEFSGAANWDDDQTLIPSEDITCIQTDSCYLQPYRDYFKLNPRPEISE